MITIKHDNLRFMTSKVDYVEEKFDSISELNNYLEKKEVNKHFKSYHDKASQRCESFPEFYMTKTYEESKELLLHGWEIGTEKIMQSLKVKALEEKTTKTIYDVAGFQASVPRYLQGIPTNMINSKKINIKKTKILNVYKYVGYLGFVSADKIVEESVKAIQIIQLLEAKGYKCNLSVISGSLTNNDTVLRCLTVRLKNASERLNVSKLSYCLAHPSFLRRTKWSWVEKSDIITYGYTSGYGKSLDKWDMEYFSRYYREKDVIIIPNYIDNVNQFVEGLNIK